MKYSPVAAWKVVVDAVVDHGEMLENPTPAPNATRISVRAAAAMPPARIAPHDTAEIAASGAPTSVSRAEAIVLSRSMMSFPWLLQPFVSMRLYRQIGTWLSAP